MSGPEFIDVWQYPPVGKVRVTGVPVSSVVITDKKYSQSGPFVPGERVSQPWPPLVLKKEKRDRQA
ncbi:MAG: hypothetical protein OXF44_03240 [Anaerolineaceae bacterium]|nr:hypothetical protein [Anaerolineaceae bacterium]